MPPSWLHFSWKQHPPAHQMKQRQDFAVNERALPPSTALPLQEHYQLGIYSSASARTVDTALALLEEAAGEWVRR